MIEHLRQLNIRITEQSERSKARFDSITHRMTEAQSSYQELDHKCANKDFLIRNLSDLLLRSAGPDLKVTSVVRYLREATYRPSFVRGLDFNLETLCRYIENENAKEQRKISCSTAPLLSTEVCSVVINFRFDLVP